MRNILHLIQSYSNIRWGFETEGEKKKLELTLYQLQNMKQVIQK